MACSPLLPVSAEGCNIELSTAQNVSGYIDVTVFIKSNPGMTSFLLKVYFDNNKLSPYSVMRGSLLPIAGTFSNNLSGTDFSEVQYVQVYFVNTPSLSDITADGALFTVRFKIESGAGGRVVFYLDNNCEVINQGETDVSYTPETGRFPITESPVEIMFTDTDLSVSDGMWRGNASGLILETTPIVQEDNVVILTAYDTSDKLVYSKFETIKSLVLDVGQPFTISGLTIPAQEGQNLKLKLFLWNGAGEAEPLAENDTRIITATRGGVE